MKTSERICTEPGCDLELYLRERCRKHYKRALRAGMERKSKRAASPADALATRVDRVGDCIVWNGMVKQDGYGQISVKGKMRAVHRVAWELAHGEIPPEMQVDHTCHVRACVNVEHLRLATRRENNFNRAGARRNSVTGVRNVSPNGKGFSVQIRKDGVTHYFGSFPSIEVASEAAERGREELFGEFAGTSIGDKNIGKAA